MMSFSSLKEEMERRKKEAEALKKEALNAVPAAAVGAGGKKYVRRGDLQGMKASSSSSNGGSSDPSSASSAAPSPSAGSAPSSSASEASSNAVEPASTSNKASSSIAGLSHHQTILALPRSEVVRRLRKYGQVVTYYGESDGARAERLYRYEVDHVAEREETGIKGGFEIGDTGRRQTKEQHARPYDDDDDDDEPSPAVPNKRQRLTEPGGGDGSGGAAAADGSGLSNSAANGGAGDDDGDGGSVGSGGSKERKSKARTITADAAAYAGPGGDKHKYIYKYFKGLLNEWEDELGARSEADKTSAKGVVDTRLLKQCKDFIRPYLKQCRARQLPGDIVSLSAEIVDHCRAR